jgi:hypothetical protein
MNVNSHSTEYLKHKVISITTLTLTLTTEWYQIVEASKRIVS